MNRKVYLIGMPGAGKTTFGKILAQALDWSFIDLDHDIEKSAGKTITDIFQDQGEAAFREAEKHALQHLADQAVDLVIATGGGAPCFHNNMMLMNASGITIFLNPSLEELEKRVKQENQRPLFHGTSVRKKLEALYRSRINHYNKAQFKIKTNNPDVHQVLTETGLS